MIDTIQPLGTLSVIEKVQVLDTTESGIILTDDTKDKNRNFYTVLKCGPGVTEIHPGDVVVVAEHAGDIVKLKDKEYKIINEHQILGVLPSNQE